MSGEPIGWRVGQPVALVTHDWLGSRNVQLDRVECVAPSGICTTSGGRRWHSDGTPIERGKRAQLLTIEAAIAREAADLAAAREDIASLRKRAACPDAEIEAALDRGDYFAARELVDRARRAMCHLHKALTDAGAAADPLARLEAHRATD